LHNKIATFIKVSDYSSKDIFGDFIKNIVFNRHKNYRIDSFIRPRDNSYENIVLNKGNFQKKLKEIFKSEEVEIVQLGTFRFGKSCWPELAIYYENEPNSLRVLWHNT